MPISSSDTARGLGLAAAVPAEAVRAAARAVEEQGYASFWLNNPPRASALPTLGQVGPETRGIHLGVGVIPLAAHPPDEIVRDVRASGVLLERFYLGIGSGAGGGGVERVEAGIDAIRKELACTIVVAALGPRMCRLAGRKADGVLLNWLTPEFARKSAEIVRESARTVGRPAPRIMAYVRVAMGDAAMGRLNKEAANYEASPHYAAHFDRMGANAMQTAVTGSTPDEIRVGLAAWDGVVDEVVARAITADDSVAAILPLIAAAAPGR